MDTAMGERVARVEVRLDGLGSEVRDLRTEVREMRAEVRASRNVIVGTVLATVLAATGLVLTMQANSLAAFQSGLANQLSAFQAGLTALQASGPNAPAPPPQPIVIQLAPPLPPPPRD